MTSDDPKRTDRELSPDAERHRVADQTVRLAFGPRYVRFTVVANEMDSSENRRD